MLALAGACYFAAMSRGPLTVPPAAWEKLPPQYREATEETLFRDLHLAIDYYAQLTMAVKDGKFDDEFEPHVEAVIWEDEDGMHLQPHVGFRKA
jgi:hypothetical protein